MILVESRQPPKRVGPLASENDFQTVLASQLKIHFQSIIFVCLIVDNVLDFLGLPCLALD